jgi:hypothetical protein
LIQGVVQDFGTDDLNFTASRSIGCAAKLQTNSIIGTRIPWVLFFGLHAVLVTLVMI